MTIERTALIRCDACRREDPLPEAKGWIAVRALFTSEEAAVEIQERYETQGAYAVDSGEFCSPRCVANWASARAAMQEMDEEFGE